MRHSRLTAAAAAMSYSGARRSLHSPTRHNHCRWGREPCPRMAPQPRRPRAWRARQNAKLKGRFAHSIKNEGHIYYKSPRQRAAARGAAKTRRARSPLPHTEHFSRTSENFQSRLSCAVAKAHPGHAKKAPRTSAPSAAPPPMMTIARGSSLPDRAACSFWRRGFAHIQHVKAHS